MRRAEYSTRVAMSEFFQEYTHLVVDPHQLWPYFDVAECLKRLPWTVHQCRGHITRRWFEKDHLTRHAVVQLALYACEPLREIPADIQYMTGVSRDGTPSQRPAGTTPDGVLPDGYYFRADPVGDLVDHGPATKNQRPYPCPTIIPLIEALAT